MIVVERGEAAAMRALLQAIRGWIAGSVRSDELLHAARRFNESCGWSKAHEVAELLRSKGMCGFLMEEERRVCVLPPNHDEGVHTDDLVREGSRDACADLEQRIRAVKPEPFASAEVYQAYLIAALRGEEASPRKAGRREEIASRHAGTCAVFDFDPEEALGSDSLCSCGANRWRALWFLESDVGNWRAVGPWRDAKAEAEDDASCAVAGSVALPALRRDPGTGTVEERIVVAYVGGQRAMLREIAEILGMPLDPDPATGPTLRDVQAFVTKERAEARQREAVLEEQASPEGCLR